MVDFSNSVIFGCGKAFVVCVCAGLAVPAVIVVALRGIAGHY